MEVRHQRDAQTLWTPHPELIYTYHILKMPQVVFILRVSLIAVKWFFYLLVVNTVIVDRPKKMKSNRKAMIFRILQSHCICILLASQYVEKKREEFRFTNDDYSQFLVDWKKTENTLSSRRNNLVVKIYDRMRKIARFSCNCWLTILFTIRLLEYFTGLPASNILANFFFFGMETRIVCIPNSVGAFG